MTESLNYSEDYIPQNFAIIATCGNIFAIDLNLVSMDKKYLKVDGVVEITGLAKDTIYQYTSKNLIPFLKLGRLIRFEESAIHDWMESELRKG